MFKLLLVTFQISFKGLGSFFVVFMIVFWGFVQGSILFRTAGSLVADEIVSSNSPRNALRKVIGELFHIIPLYRHADPSDAWRFRLRRNVRLEPDFVPGFWRDYTFAV